MAVRSGAGTGVTISLVIFVIATIFMMIVAILFYRGQVQAVEAEQEAKSQLAQHVKPAEQSADWYKQQQASAGPQQSVAGVMRNRLADVMTFVAGDPTKSPEQLQADVARYGVGAGQGQQPTIIAALQAKDTQLRDREGELRSRTDALAQRDQEITQLRGQLDQLQEQTDERIEQVRGELDRYMQAAQQYNSDIDAVKERMNQSVADLRGRYEGQVLGLEDRIDQLTQDNVLMKSRVDELQNLVRTRQEQLQNPALLVDGTIIDTAGADEVYISRGRTDRVVAGMTFEVYNDQNAIIGANGEVRPGKASLQITEVSERTSKAKVTRSVPGRPVVREDIIANAAYDPKYSFKFLVHGKFDVNGDGRPSDAEAAYIRSRIIDWGGTVVEVGPTDTMPGDLDFLVLGEQPPQASPLPPNPEPHVIEQNVRTRQAYNHYQGLFTAAREAQIPVLNANRFFILTGMPTGSGS